MSTTKFTLGMLCAGALAFALVGTAYALTKPVFGPASAAEHGTEDAHNNDNEHADESAAGPIDIAILGQWKAPEPANQNAFVEFSDDDTWLASDGCNGASGDWEVDSTGSFLGGEPGVMTLIACDNVNIPQAVWGAAHAEVTADNHLILTNEDGEEFELVKAEQH